MPDIEVIATDGNINKKIIWLSVNSEGIYFDLSIRRGSHMSVHKDGSMWATQNLKMIDNSVLDSKAEEKEMIAQYVPLSDVKRMYTLGTYSFVTDISKLEVPNCEVKNLDSVILIDTRRYSSSNIVFDLSIVEPNRFDHFRGMESKYSEIHIYTRFNPWIVISIY